jgi:hypothetical protein
VKSQKRPRRAAYLAPNVTARAPRGHRSRVASIGDDARDDARRDGGARRRARDDARDDARAQDAARDRADNERDE